MFRGIVKLLEMIWSPGNSRRFPEALATAPTLRRPVGSPCLQPARSGASSLRGSHRRPPMPAGAAGVGHGTRRGQHAPGLPRRLPPLPAIRTWTRGPRRMLTPVGPRAPRAGCAPGPALPLRRRAGAERGCCRGARPAPPGATCARTAAPLASGASVAPASRARGRLARRRAPGLACTMAGAPPRRQGPLVPWRGAAPLPRRRVSSHPPAPGRRAAGVPALPPAQRRSRRSAVAQRAALRERDARAEALPGHR